MTTGTLNVVLLDHGPQVVPHDDLITHELRWTCPCGPRLVVCGICTCCGRLKTQLVHHALDGRP